MCTVQRLTSCTMGNNLCVALSLTIQIFLSNSCIKKEVLSFQHDMFACSDTDRKYSLPTSYDNRLKLHNSDARIVTVDSGDIVEIIVTRVMMIQQISAYKCQCTMMTWQMSTRWLQNGHCRLGEDFLRMSGVVKNVHINSQHLTYSLF